MGGTRSRCFNCGYRAIISKLSLVVYVHMSKWAAILMLRMCYKYNFGNICVNILKTNML